MDKYQKLVQCLFFNQSCTLPGIGTLSVDTKPAELDFPNARILPPVESISFEPSTNAQADTPNKFSDISYAIQEKLDKGEKVEINGVGTFFKNNIGIIKFIPEILHNSFYKPVHAERVIRENAVHSVLVGDTETTSTVMTDLLNTEEEIKDRWWIWAAAIGIIALSIVGYNYYNNNKMFSNNSAVTLQQEPVHHLDQQH